MRTIKAQTPKAARDEYGFRPGECGHDTYVHHVMDQPGAPEAFLRSQLPSDVARGLRLETVTPVQGSFINDWLKRLFADFLYEVETVKGEKRLVYVLVEHKSRRDKRVAMQLLDYVAAIYLLWRRKRCNAGKPVPKLVMVVMYHGAREWGIPTTFAGLYEDYDESDKVSLNFGYILVDVARIPPESMRCSRSSRCLPK